jgi:hypothetical protein
MAPRLSVVLVAGAVACVALAGCRDREQASTVTSRSGYVAAVDALIGPPAEMVGTLQEASGASTDAVRPSRQALEGVVRNARQRLASFRALRLPDPVTRAQRDRVARAYEPLPDRMEAVAVAVAGGDRAAVAAAAGPFLDSVKALSSAAGSSPSR